MPGMPLLALIAWIPGISLFGAVDLTLADGVTFVDTGVPTGPPLASGDNATFDFVLKDSLGRSLADTYLRGLPYSCRLGESTLDPLLTRALEGTRPGTERLALFSGEILPEGIGGILPSRTDFVLTLNVHP